MVPVYLPACVPAYLTPACLSANPGSVHIKLLLQIANILAAVTNIEVLTPHDVQYQSK